MIWEQRYTLLLLLAHPHFPSVTNFTQHIIKKNVLSTLFKFKGPPVLGDAQDATDFTDSDDDNIVDPCIIQLILKLCNVTDPDIAFSNLSLWHKAITNGKFPDVSACFGVPALLGTQWEWWSVFANKHYTCSIYPMLHAVIVKCAHTLLYQPIILSQMVVKFRNNIKQELLKVMKASDPTITISDILPYFNYWDSALLRPTSHPEPEPDEDVASVRWVKLLIYQYQQHMATIVYNKIAQQAINYLKFLPIEKDSIKKSSTVNIQVANAIV